MKIQSFSVVVPNKACANNCPFCVSRMVNSDSYPNLMDINHPHYDINVSEYLKRMRYVAENGCQTMMLTGTSEPQQNKQFLATLALLHKQIGSPFTNIEMQCTGLFLQDNRDYLRFLRNFVGVNTIALSVNSTDDEENNKILGHKLKDKKICIKSLCDLLKAYDFNIRLCFNLSSMFNWFANDNASSEMLSEMLKTWKTKYHADQLTFRKLYADEHDTPQGKWIDEHYFSIAAAHALKTALEKHPVIGKTMYGANIRDCNGMSTIFDDDCMGKNPTTDVMKYLILRPNCKLYSSWDTPASLVF